MTKGYLISESLKDKIHATIERVAGAPYGGGVTNVTPRLEFPPAAPGDTPRLAAYARTAVWAKGKTMAVTFYTHSGTAFGLSSAGTAGTATALNVSGEFLVLPNGDTNEAIGPTPTMTWCIIGKSKGGGNVALEAQQPPIRLAAYDITQGPWGKGERRNVAFYDVVGGSIQFSGVTATAGNVSQTFYPMSTASSGTAVGPTPTMAWAVVSESPSGHLLAVEAENDPVVRLATTQSSGQWQRGSMRTVQITGTTRTEDVYSNFDYYSELDLPQGLAYAKTPYAPAGGTANVVIGPPPVPMHNAIYTASGDWLQGQTKQVSIPPSDGVTHARAVDAVNVYFEKIEGGNTKMAIGKFGTAYHVISTDIDAGEVKTAQRTSFGDKDTPWNLGSRRNVTIVGTTETEEVVSVFDTYSHLDLRKGLAVAKAKDPENPSSTAYIVIAPAPRALYQATTNATGKWAKDEEKVLTVPAGDGRPSSLTINVINKFFDSISLDGKPIAVGKFGDQYYALSGGGEDGVEMAHRTDSGPWQRSSLRNVRIHGTTTEVGAYNAVGHFEEFDGRGSAGLPGLGIIKGLDASGAGGGTTYYVISPPPARFATSQFTGAWSIGTDKTLQASAGVGETAQVSVTNLFFDVPQTSATVDCAISKKEDQWYLVNVPIETATAVFVRNTATINYLGTESTSQITYIGTESTSRISFIGTAGTSQITFVGVGSTSELRYATAGEEKTCSYITDVSVTCDENGDLQLTKTTGECKFIPVGEEKTATIISTGDTQTAVTVSMSGTQTAAIINVNATQTATIVNVGATQTMVAVTSTFTATFLKFKV